MSKTFFTAALFALATVAAIPANATTITYSYSTNYSNPLLLNGEADYLTINFALSEPLADNSTYNISVSASPTSTGNWSAFDTRGFSLSSGTSAPISIVPAPGLLEGGALSACASPCFGGTVVTDNAGEIVQWNLIAGSFLSYNTPLLGSLDALGNAQIFEENTLNGPTGAWTARRGHGHLPHPESVSPVPLPPNLPLFGCAVFGLGAFAWRRKVSA